MFTACVFPGPSRSLASRPLPESEWFLKPSPLISSNSPSRMSSSAIAFPSWRVTQAVLPFSETAMYSGSRSWATDAPGPKIRTLGSRSSAEKSSKPAMVTSESSRWRLWRGSSMIATEPSGSTVYSSFGSPSLATRSLRPSGVKTTLSGSAPTVTAPSSSPSVSKNATWPGSVFVSATTPTATRPRSTATLVGSTPYALRSIANSFVGSSGSEASSTSRVSSALFVTKSRSLRGS